jgi:SAM-dependent MidA family methyltransferase
MPDAIPFAQWMERALYDPQRGYYARRITGFGRCGDFSTSATLDDTLAQGIAAWLKAELKRDGRVRTIIEVGGGDGSLAENVLRALGWILRRRVRFQMVERSEVLRDQQQERLWKHRVTWHDDLAAALDACEGRALIYHNELLDAFPVTLVQWNAEAQCWQQGWMEEASGGWRLSFQAATIDAAALEKYSVLSKWKAGAPPPHSAQRCETGTAALAWLRLWAPHWKRGAMLTLDYGDLFPQIYHRRPAGTLRAYLMHQVLTGDEVFSSMGRQDITADVNFSDLIQWGRVLGWEHDRLITQREFLQAHVSDLPKRIANNPRAAFLSDEGGAGSAFKVLVQRTMDSSARE